MSLKKKKLPGGYEKYCDMRNQLFLFAYELNQCKMFIELCQFFLT